MLNEYFHIVYQTTNLINGKIYIGKHSTKNINDGYIGSGAEISLAIKEFGRESFKRDILFCALSSDDAYYIEGTLVTAEFVVKDTNYNVIPGGQGMGSGIPRTEEVKRKISESLKGPKSPNFGKPGNMLGKSHKKESKIQMSIKRSGEKHHMYGKSHKEESKIKNAKSKEKYIYSLQTPNGIIQTSNLKQYCRDNNLVEATIRKGYKTKEGIFLLERSLLQLQIQ